MASISQEGGGLVERASSALVMVDDEMVIVEANGSAAELFGLDAEGLVAESLYELLAPEYRRDLRSVSDSLGDGRPQAGHVSLMKSNGEQVGCSFSATPDFNPGVHLWILTPLSQNGSRDGVAADQSSTNGSDPRNGSPGPARLTQREAEVLTLLARGETNQTIAEQLHLSPETVRSHTRTARLRLGAKSRSHAIALAIESAQIDVAPARNRFS